MAQAPSHPPQHAPNQNNWTPILIWAGIQFLLCVTLFFLLVQVAPEFQKMFEEYGIELPALTQFMMTRADRVIRLWPLAWLACLFYPCVSIGLMFVARPQKTVFRLMAIGLTLLPLILILAFLFSLIMPTILICNGLNASK